LNTQGSSTGEDQKRGVTLERPRGGRDSEGEERFFENKRKGETFLDKRLPQKCKESEVNSQRAVRKPGEDAIMAAPYLGEKNTSYGREGADI